jgi:HSP20 family protein
MNPLSKWHPFRELEEMQDRVLRALRLGQSGDAQQSLVVADWSPSVDISEDDKEYLIKADLPEVKKEDVKVTVENGVVSIRGERKFEKEEKNKKFHRVERSYGSFQRSFSLPEDADPAKVSAEYKDGLLQVRLGKSKAKQPKQVEVKVN